MRLIVGSPPYLPLMYNFHASIDAVKLEFEPKDMFWFHFMDESYRFIISPLPYSDGAHTDTSAVRLSFMGETVDPL